MRDEFLVRQSSIINPEVLYTPITVVGAGAVGSAAVLCLAKMGFGEIYVYDTDTVDEANVGMQFYGEKDIGRPKVRALQDLVDTLCTTNINAREEFYNADSAPSRGITVSAVDSMESRSLIHEAHCTPKAKLQTKLLIDPRMGAEFASVYATRPGKPEDMSRYVKTLYSDDRAVAEPCTAKATMYTAMILGGYIGKVVKNFLVDKVWPHTTLFDIRTGEFQTYNQEV